MKRRSFIQALTGLVAAVPGFSAFAKPAVSTVVITGREARFYGFQLSCVRGLMYGEFQSPMCYETGELIPWKAAEILSERRPPTADWVEYKVIPQNMWSHDALYLL